MAEDQLGAELGAPGSFAPVFVAEAHRRLVGESLPRLRQCLGLLSEEEVWIRYNDRVNSVGNLVLHLCGNARQWLGSGLAGWPDNRNRDAEFDEQGPIPKEALLRLIDQTEAMITEVLQGLRPEQLTQVHQVQVFKETGIAILVHVVEHFSYHVGQVTYFVKAHLKVDTGYYQGLDLNQPKA